MSLANGLTETRNDFAQSASALEYLRDDVEAFIDLEALDPTLPAAYHRVLESVYGLCASIVECERSGFTREDIVAVLEPVRRIHAESPFVRRLQEWPRGYPGDFETVEYLCAGRCQAEKDTLAALCEIYALSRSIAQQHRNKVQHQAARTVETLFAHPGTAKILSIACGSSPDMRTIAPHLRSFLGELWLNDSDDDALALSTASLSCIRERCRVLPGNALRVVKRLTLQHAASFDLVLAGGLFDYLPDKQAAYLIEHACKLVKPGRVFYFTNIASGNPYRPLIEYSAIGFSSSALKTMCAGCVHRAASAPTRCALLGTRRDSRCSSRCNGEEHGLLAYSIETH